MKEYFYHRLSEAFVDSGLVACIESSVANKVTVYFEVNDVSHDELLNFFGDAFKYGLEADVNSLNSIGNLNCSQINLRKGYLSDLEFSFEEGFKKLNYDIHNKEYYLLECKRIFEKGDCYVLEDSGQILALFLTAEFQMSEVVKNLVAWIWISEKCSYEEKESIKHHLSNYLTSKNTNILASVHNKNVASLKFFTKMNFKKFCIIC